MFANSVRRSLLSSQKRVGAQAFSASSVTMRRTVLNTGVMFVPQQEAYVVERFGGYSKMLQPGLNFLVPFIDRVAYVHSLKVEMIEIANQSAVFTKDNVHLDMDGVLYYQIQDPFAASYNVEDPEFAIKQLAMSTMRSEIGQLSLDETFRERSALNERIVAAVSEGVKEFGIRCLRYEVREISPPPSVVNAMELEVVAERRKRQSIIDSEGERRAAVNVAEGEKEARVLASEAEAEETINLRKGEAEGIELIAQARAEATRIVGESLKSNGGQNAATLEVAQQYVKAFGKLAKESNTLMLPSNASDPSSMIAQAMAIYKNQGGQWSGNSDSNNKSSGDKNDFGGEKPEWIN